MGCCCCKDNDDDEDDYDNKHVSIDAGVVLEPIHYIRRIEQIMSTE